MIWYASFLYSVFVCIRLVVYLMYVGDCILSYICILLLQSFIYMSYTGFNSKLSLFIHVLVWHFCMGFILILRLKGGKSLRMKRLSKVRRVRVAVQKVRVKARRKSLIGGNTRRRRQNMPHQPHLNNNHLGMAMTLLRNMYHSNLHRLM